MNNKGFFVAKIVSLLGFVALLGMIMFGVVERDIISEGNIMLAVYWGKFTFIDIYIAFVVFYAWIVIREKSLIKSILWFVLIMFGGSMSICLYLFIALHTSNNDLTKFMLGKRR